MIFFFFLNNFGFVSFNLTIIEILKYLLQYNSEIYLQKKETVESKMEQESDENNDEEEFDLSKPICSIFILPQNHCLSARYPMASFCTTSKIKR